MQTLFSRLAELSYDRADALMHPRLGGCTYLRPVDRAAAELAARELETAAAFWRGICPRSVASCLIEARNLREAETLADLGVIPV